MVYPQLALALVKVVVEVVLLMATILVAVKIVNVMTRGLDEWKEIHKGNVAVAIYMAGMIISVSLIVSPGINFFLNSLSLNLAGMRAVTVFYAIEAGLIQLAIAFVVAIVVQYLTLVLLKSIHRLMAPYDEWEEMEKGNVAAGILMGVILAVVGIVLSSAMPSILDLIRTFVPEIIAIALP